MLKHILVPLDGSEVAELALDYVTEVTDPTEGRVSLLTVLDVPDYPVAAYYPAVMAYETGSADMTEKIIPQAQGYLRKVAERLESSGYHVTIETIIGDPAVIIVERAEELGVNAILMSTHGRSGISRWIFGSVASKVLSSTPCPVFIVPMKAKSKTQTQTTAVVTEEA